MLNADKPFKLSIVQVLFAFLSNGMVATSVTVTTIIRYQPASQASLISNLAHNDPGKLVITPSMQLSGGEPRPLSVSFYFVPQEKNITVKLARLGEPIF